VPKKKDDEIKHEPGIYFDIPEEEYHRDYKDWLGSHDVMNLYLSPADFKHARENHKDSTALRFGRASHNFMLEGGDRISVADESSKTDKSAQFKLRREGLQAEGLTLITVSEHKQLTAMKRVFDSHGLASGLRHMAKIEVSAFWENKDYMLDKEHGIKCKSRYDMFIDLERKIVCDYKSTRDSVDPFRFESTCINFDYPMQAAHYLDGIKLLTGDDSWKFMFIAQEKTPPFKINVFRCDDDFIDIGHRKNNVAFVNYWYSMTYRPDFDTGFPEKIYTLTAPGWAKNKVLDAREIKE